MFLTTKDLKSSYDVIVIGGGNAGIEASTASARMGAKTLLITFNYNNLGTLSCNPSIGGIGKGTVVKEIDALDGVMAMATDLASINRKNLNASKGPAVWGPRHQIDRDLYKSAMRDLLKDYVNLDIVENQVVKLIIDNTNSKKKVCGVEVKTGEIINSKAVVITTGTFLNGETICGEERISAGRIHEPPAIDLANYLHTLGLEMTRLKTGTPCRLDKNTINFEDLEIQSSDATTLPMSYLNKEINVEQLDCYITYTNDESHKVIKEGWGRIPAVNGDIKYNGPRYCPSIETKLQRFDHPRHQVFLEPEGLTSNLVYPNGISTSMPKDMQDAFIHTIKGLKNAKIMQYGYAIEYDLIDPREVKQTLETKKIEGLFLAGQIIGTTGYEEAGGLGCIAGINAGLFAGFGRNKEFVLSREQAYIGVMIDDITTLGVGAEPYRLFTSRSEYRLACRADNADFRLTELGYKIGCVKNERWQVFSNLKDESKNVKSVLLNKKHTPSEWLKLGIEVNNDGIARTAYEILSYPKMNTEKVFKLCGFDKNNISRRTKEHILFDAMYEKYIIRQQSNIEEMRQNQNIKIPAHFDYKSIKSLSNEEVEKLEKTRPETIHQTSRIPGITPTSILAILEKIKK